MTDRPVTCSFGVAWARHVDGRRCTKCEAEGRRLARAFRAAVKRGQYDHAGYTPAERRAQEKRK